MAKAVEMNGKGSRVMKDAEERKRGGRVGHKGHGMAGKFARGGSPFSAAHTTKKTSGGKGHE